MNGYFMACATSTMTGQRSGGAVGRRGGESADQRGLLVRAAQLCIVAAAFFRSSLRPLTNQPNPRCPPIPPQPIIPLHLPRLERRPPHALREKGVCGDMIHRETRRRVRGHEGCDGCAGEGADVVVCWRVWSGSVRSGRVDIAERRMILQCAGQKDGTSRSEAHDDARELPR
jgi:hypothetical protein